MILKIDIICYFQKLFKICSFKVNLCSNPGESEDYMLACLYLKMRVNPKSIFYLFDNINGCPFDHVLLINVESITLITSEITEAFLETTNVCNIHQQVHYE